MVIKKLNFPPEIKKQISNLIAVAESSTTGSIVPVITERSSAYSDLSWRFGFAFSLLSIFCISLIIPGHSPLFYFWLQIPALAFGLALGSRSWVISLFLHNDRAEHEVKAHAIQSFFEFGLTGTKHRNGVLIFVSVLERRIELIADSGIHAKVGEGAWDAVVENLGQSLKKGNSIAGLKAAIVQVGAILSEHFPSDGKSKQTNELSDDLQIVE